MTWSDLNTFGKFMALFSVASVLGLGSFTVLWGRMAWAGFKSNWAYAALALALSAAGTVGFYYWLSHPVQIPAAQVSGK